MKCLLTGALGYISSALMPLLLNRGHEVVGYDNCSGRTTDTAIELSTHPSFEFIKGDILDKDLNNKIPSDIDLIIHLAAMVGDPLCKKYPDFAWLVNTEGTKNIVESFPNTPIIFSSTGSVYGKVDGVCTEESPTNPLSVYAKSKLLAEKYIKGSGNYIIYRFATAFGLAPSLRLDLLPNDFCHQAFRNKYLVVAQADFRRTFCHVRDLASSLSFAIENFDKMKNQTYNVGNKQGNITKRELAELLKKKTKCSVFYEDSIYKDTDMRDYDTSIEKIDKTGWKASISIEEGIDELLKAMSLIQIDSRYHQKI